MGSLGRRRLREQAVSHIMVDTAMDVGVDRQKRHGLTQHHRFIHPHFSAERRVGMK